MKFSKFMEKGKVESRVKVIPPFTDKVNLAQVDYGSNHVNVIPFSCIQHMVFTSLIEGKEPKELEYIDTINGKVKKLKFDASYIFQIVVPSGTELWYQGVRYDADGNIEEDAAKFLPVQSQMIETKTGKYMVHDVFFGDAIKCIIEAYYVRAHSLGNEYMVGLGTVLHYAGIDDDKMRGVLTGPYDIKIDHNYDQSTKLIDNDGNVFVVDFRL